MPKKINQETDDTEETDSLTESEPALTTDDQEEPVPSQQDSLRALTAEYIDQLYAKHAQIRQQQECILQLQEYLQGLESETITLLQQQEAQLQVVTTETITRAREQSTTWRKDAKTQNESTTQQHPGPIASKGEDLVTTRLPRFFNKERQKHPEPLSSKSSTVSNKTRNTPSIKKRVPGDLCLAEIHQAAIALRTCNDIATECNIEDSDQSTLNDILWQLGTNIGQLRRTRIEEMRARLGKAYHQFTLNQLVQERVDFRKNKSYKFLSTESDDSTLDSHHKRREPVDDTTLQAGKRRKQYSPTPVSEASADKVQQEDHTSLNQTENDSSVVAAATPFRP